MAWLVIITVIILVCFGLIVLVGAPWLPTLKISLDSLFDELGKIKGSVFIDLGCGSGGVLVAAAQRGARVVGYELNPFLCLITWWRLRPYDARVHWGNFWAADLSEADIVYTFLINRFMPKLERKLVSEMPKGSLFVSSAFELPHKTLSHKALSAFYYKF